MTLAPSSSSSFFFFLKKKKKNCVCFSILCKSIIIIFNKTINDLILRVFLRIKE